MPTWMRSNRFLSIIAATVLGLSSLGFILLHGQFLGGVNVFQLWPFFLTLDPAPTLSATALRTLVPSPLSTLTTIATATSTPLAARTLSVPVILQELPLSCEYAGMRMVLAALFGFAPSERELLACMPRNPNPYLGFRGDPAGYNRFPDGSINWDNYGAYAPAVAEALNKCGLEPAGGDFVAIAVSNASYEQVAKAVLGGYPVMVWVTKQQQAQTTAIDTPEGLVQLVFGEHVWVVVGYHGDGTFDVHDPYPQKTGVQTFRVRSFPNWELFNRMAVFVTPRKATSQLHKRIWA